MSCSSADSGVHFPPVISDTVRDAVISTFTPICGVSPSLLSQAEDDDHGPGVVSVIAFTGEPSWSLALMLPASTASLMARKFAGFEIPYESTDMGDAVGELANVLAGDVSAMLERRGVKAQMSLPFVARGQGVELLPASGVMTTRMGFVSPEGKFWFKLVTGKQGCFPNRRPGT